MNHDKRKVEAVRACFNITQRENPKVQQRMAHSGLRQESVKQGRKLHFIRSVSRSASAGFELAAGKLLFQDSQLRGIFLGGAA